MNDKDFEKIIQRQINYSVHPLKYLEKDVTNLEIDDEKYVEDDAYNGELTDFNSAIRAYISDNKDMFYGFKDAVNEHHLAYSSSSITILWSRFTDWLQMRNLLRKKRTQ